MDSNQFEEAISAAEQDTNANPQEKLHANVVNTDTEGNTQRTEPEVERI